MNNENNKHDHDIRQKGLVPFELFDEMDEAIERLAFVQASIVTCGAFGNGSADNGAIIVMRDALDSLRRILRELIVRTEGNRLDLTVADAMTDVLGDGANFSMGVKTADAMGMPVDALCTTYVRDLTPGQVHAMCEVMGVTAEEIVGA